VPRKGRAAPPGFRHHVRLSGLLRSPFAAQGRSYTSVVIASIRFPALAFSSLIATNFEVGV